ncbi:Acyl-CoA synthetase member 2 mitochondrial [Sparganum proliferum]
MGSPISTLVAELVFQELEKVAFDHSKPAFRRQYADDTFAIIETSEVAGFQDLPNGIVPDIQSTMEEQHAEQLPFLDVLVTRTPNGELSTTVYGKELNTAQILKYHENHPMAHKRSCVRTLFQRVRTHCSEPEGQVRELRHLWDQLARNE